MLRYFLNWGLGFGNGLRGEFVSRWGLVPGTSAGDGGARTKGGF